MSSNPKRDQEIDSLVASSQAGNSEAFGRLYDLFVNQIYRYIYYRVGSADAEDLTEMVFLKAWEHIKQYRPGRYRFSAWIFRIAHNLVVDNYRAHSPVEELSDDTPDTRHENNATRIANEHFDNVILARAMGGLKDQYRQILVLKYINDLNNEEIGQITGKSQAALRILQFRALRHLKNILENMGINGF